MIMLLAIVKFILLIIGIIYGFSNIAKVIHKMNISSFQLYAMAIGVIGFLELQFRFL